MDSSDPRLRWPDAPVDAFGRHISLSLGEQMYINGLLRGCGFALTQVSHSQFLNDHLRENFKVGAETTGNEVRTKRVAHHNRLFKEEPWTSSTLKLVQKLANRTFKADNGDREKKIRESFKVLPLKNPLREQLEVVKKKLVRGDYIGMTHFEADMEKIWTDARAQEKPGSFLYKASIQLELAFNEGLALLSDFDAEVKRAALTKSKSSVRRKKSTIRKGSDHIESKATADHEHPLTISPFEQSLFQVELEEKLPKLKSKDFSGVRKILKRFGCQSSSSTLAVDRRLDINQLQEPALRAVMAYIRRKVDKRDRRPVQSKPKRDKPTKGMMAVEENTAVSSNSSFLTGKFI